MVASEAAWRGRLGALAVALAVAVACAPLLVHGFPRGHDWPHELVRVAQMGAALGDGPRPAAWAPDLYHGFGSPIFLFYAPLFALLAWAIAAMGAGVAGGAAAALALGTVVSAAAGGALGRAAAGDAAAPWWSSPGARLGAWVLVLHPYRLGDLYVRNACGEATGLALAPLALAGALEAARRPRRAFWLIALGLAATVLAHNLTALALAAALPLVAAAGAGRREGRRTAVVVAGGAAAGLGLSAWFWWPALALEPLVRTAELLAGKFHYARSLLSLPQLAGGFPAPGPWALAVLAGGLIGALLLRGGDPPRARWRRLMLAAVGGGGLLLLLMTPLAAAAWEAIPRLRYLQFPWRLGGALGWSLVVIAAVGAAAIHRRLGRRAGLIAEAALALAALAAALPVLVTTRPLPPEVRRDLVATLHREAVRQFPHRATVGNEYLPRGADPAVAAAMPTTPLLAAPPRIEVRGAGSRLLVRNPTSEAVEVELARWAFPGWSARADAGVARTHSSPRGTLLVELPADSATWVDFAAPASRRAGLVISAASLIGLLAAAVGRRR